MPRNSQKWKLLAALLCLGLTSCGIETVATLPTPSVDYTTQQTNFLTYTHSTSSYAGYQFSGYLVYYKISPYTGDVSTLLADRDTLASSPTVNQLQSLGYTPIEVLSPPVAADKQAESASQTLQFLPSSDGEVLTLDFSPVVINFGSSSYDEPVITESAKTPSPLGSLYRSPSVGMTSTDKLFSSFSASTYLSNLSTARPADVSAVSSGTFANRYQIEVFLVAFGATDTLVPIYSNPAPWGVISPIGTN